MSINDHISKALADADLITVDLSTVTEHLRTVYPSEAVILAADPATLRRHLRAAFAPFDHHVEQVAERHGFKPADVNPQALADLRKRFKADHAELARTSDEAVLWLLGLREPSNGPPPLSHARA
jgi:hypothetical protein